MRRFFGWYLCLVFLTLLGRSVGAQEASFRALLSRLAPQDPQASLGSLKARPGFRVELVCSEPLVSDPIAIDWGPDGRLWVVEMGDYPQGGDPAADAQGRVRWLEDSDHDGRYDRSTVFLDKLNFPTGVMAWKRGILIACAPDILYAEDSDGDGRADRQEVLLRGFVVANPQHQVNSLCWGLDNWIYGANGDNGGTISSFAGGTPVDIHARDFRFDPQSGELQTQTGMSQYGRCRDDWGNWFGGRNLQPIWHCALDDQYLRRNSFLVPPDPCVDLLEPPIAPPVYPISTALPRFNELWTMNRFTAACGICIYRDELFGPSFESSGFVCEPAYNLVHRLQLRPHGVTFRGERAPDEQTSEFLASTDHWFRPVQARTGPDGALWVVDMYRLIIEHPDFIPQQWHAELDFRAGRGMGRIYRVLPEGVDARPWQPLDQLSVVELASLLDTPNGPCRDMIQQRLVQADDHTAIVPLRRLLCESRRAQIRVSALATLDGLNAIDAATLQVSLADSHPAVRRQAIRLAEPLLDTQPALALQVLQRLDDPDPQVRLQLAYALGEWHDRRAGDALARLAARDAQDPLLIAAVMSSATHYPDQMLRRLLELPSLSAAQVTLVENLMRLVFEAERLDALAFGVQHLVRPREDRYETWQYSLLAGLADAVEFRGRSLRDLRDEGNDDLTRAIDQAVGLLGQASRDALDPEIEPVRRVEALRLVGRGVSGDEPTAEPTVEQLAQLLVPQTPVAVQRGAVEALARRAPADLAAILLEGWSQLGPDIRPVVLDILMQEEPSSLLLLDLVAAGDLSANELGVANRSRLILHTSSGVRARAAEVFRPSTPAERLAAMDRIRTRLGTPADVDRGRDVFRKHCATCHRLEEEGTDIGPNLLALTDRSSENLLVSILDPDRAVEPRYVEYSAVTERGRIFSGIIASETGNSLTLVDAQGSQHTLLRSELVELVSTGKSLMPVGVEELIGDPQDLLNLIAYLQWVQPDPAAKRPAIPEEHRASAAESQGVGE